MTAVTIKDPTKELNRFEVVRYELPEFPRQVKVETARACSAACPWCHLWGRDEVKTPMTFMDMGLVEKLLDDIASWAKPLKEIVPTNYGELLMNKRWVEILQMMARKLPKTEIALVTTGILLNPENLEKLALIPTLAYCNFSINSFFAETWERQHRRPGKLMLGAVQAVHNLRDRRPDVRFNVSMVYDPEIVTELERDLFLEYWTSFGQVTVSPRSSAGWPGRAPKIPVTLPCRSIFDGLTVFDQGEVGAACCFDGLKEPSLNLGRFPQDKLLDIWRGEKLKTLTATHNSGRRPGLPLCKVCTFA